MLYGRPPAPLHPTTQRCPCFTVMTASLRTDPEIVVTKAVPKNRHKQGSDRRLTYLAQPALAGCSSALASAPPVAPPNLCLLAAALPLLAATCLAVLRWLASRLK